MFHVRIVENALLILPWCEDIHCTLIELLSARSRTFIFYFLFYFISRVARDRLYFQKRMCKCRPLQKTDRDTKCLTYILISTKPDASISIFIIKISILTFPPPRSPSLLGAGYFTVNQQTLRQLFGCFRDPRHCFAISTRRIILNLFLYCVDTDPVHEKKKNFR